MTAMINKKFQLQKFPGKGGWTYAAIPELTQNKSNPFGWVQVSGSIDQYPLNKYKLMPMGNGSLFLPVKAEIRKKIKKQAGDWVTVTLYIDENPKEVPAEFIDCLKGSPKALHLFNKLNTSQQKEFVDWIYSAKTDQTKVDRIVASINKLELGKKFRDQ